MKFVKKILVILVSVGSFFALLIAFINIRIIVKSIPFMFDDIDEVPSQQTVVILGAYVYPNGWMSDMLKDRVDTAIELYEAGKVEKILVSGDHGQTSYDEVNTVKDYLLKQGIDPSDIFLDHAGFDTYDSLYRARDVFQVESAIVVTQEFHLSRAVFIARSLDMNVYGVKADKHIYRSIIYNRLRELASRVKANYNVVFNSKPTYLGSEIPISGDGRASWD